MNHQTVRCVGIARIRNAVRVTDVAPKARPYCAAQRRQSGGSMSLRKFVPLVALMTTGLLTLPFSKVGAQQPRSVRVDFGKKDIAGVVTSSKGLEAGVWVIAETTELPTKFVRIVVTDDQGRYLIPHLPEQPRRSMRGTAARRSVRRDLP